MCINFQCMCRWLVLRPQADGLSDTEEQKGIESNTTGIVHDWYACVVAI